MGWFVPLHRSNHPCVKPTPEETREHRSGEMWRCEVCYSLWMWRNGGWDLLDNDPILRWRYRKHGYTQAPRTRGPHDD